ncbi:MAG: hypothetical protein AAF092_10245 [Pseudomonadota bacterium]
MTGAEASAYSVALILPALVLAALAWVLPTWLAGRLPETMLALGANLALSAVVLWLFAAAGFAVSYALQGVPLDRLWPLVDHFVSLGRTAALFWGPILLLALAMQPQTWRPDL